MPTPSAPLSERSSCISSNPWRVSAFQKRKRNKGEQVSRLPARRTNPPIDGNSLADTDAAINEVV
mgnify:CR=1 FL=1